MGYHHLALAARDMAALHHFYEEVMGFELVKVEVAPVPDGGWAKHFFYRMDGDDSRFIAFWELHDVPGTANVETNLSRAAGVPDFINHIAFDVPTADELERRKARWLAAGRDDPGADPLPDPPFLGEPIVARDLDGERVDLRAPAAGVKSSRLLSHQVCQARRARSRLRRSPSAGNGIRWPVIRASSSAAQRRTASSRWRRPSMTHSMRGSWPCSAYQARQRAAR